MKRFAACAFLLIETIGCAQAAPPETITYQAVTAYSPEGISRLRVTPVDENNGYEIDLFVIAPNQTQHTGHIQGFATLDGERLTLTVPNTLPDGTLDKPPLCTLIIEVNEKRAKVASEKGCAFHAGAGASFFEQGQNLVRVP